MYFTSTCYTYIVYVLVTRISSDSEEKIHKIIDSHPPTLLSKHAVYINLAAKQLQPGNVTYRREINVVRAEI